VFDLASGLKVVRDRRHAVGASTVTGADIDAFAAVAIELNARANGRRVAVMHHDVLDEVSEVVVILARKCWYDAALADQRSRGSIGRALAGSRFWWVVTRPLVPADQRPGRPCPLNLEHKRSRVYVLRRGRVTGHESGAAACHRVVRSGPGATSLERPARLKSQVS
jgi:hypothetical protein